MEAITITRADVGRVFAVDSELTRRERDRIAAILTRAAWLYYKIEALPEARATPWRRHELSAIYWLLWLAFGTTADVWWRELLKRPTPEEAKAA